MTKITTKPASNTCSLDASKTPISSLGMASKPYSITLTGHTVSTMAQAAVLIRQGYMPCPDMALEAFPAIGQITIVLVLGSPEQYAIDAAASTMAAGVARERAQYLRDVEAAAARQVEAAARTEKEAKRAALILEQRKQLAALEAEIAAV